jgi:hypothetical protein
MLLLVVPPQGMLGDDCFIELWWYVHDWGDWVAWLLCVPDRSSGIDMGVAFCNHGVQDSMAWVRSK